MTPDQPTEPPAHHAHMLEASVPITAALRLAAASRFSNRWFVDTLEQSRLPGQDARRREIVFAVCLAETYLFEWVLHDICHNDWDSALKYFPPDGRRGVDEKWRQVPKALAADGRLKAAPDLGGPHGEDWLELVDRRDALSHAAVSRPLTRQSDDPTPMVLPSFELEAIPPGWALRIIVDRITRLHDAAGTPRPPWLKT